jgi:phosphatidylserine/phosphatidylglycerophosphate/cardiolipin synthase-like enzyme
VDGNIALVGSANFSNRGRDRNLEVGALIRDHHFVQSLLAAWDEVDDELTPVPAQQEVAG